jgi:catechol 2,3-dioxygenase-like lactoylglutathione lyase family enzyme
VVAGRFRVGLRVADVAEAAQFYRGLGFDEVGSVPNPEGVVVMTILEREGVQLIVDALVGMPFPDSPRERQVQSGPRGLGVAIGLGVETSTRSWSTAAPPAAKSLLSPRTRPGATGCSSASTLTATCGSSPRRSPTRARPTGSPPHARAGSARRSRWSPAAPPEQPRRPHAPQDGEAAAPEHGMPAAVADGRAHQQSAQRLDHRSHGVVSAAGGWLPPWATKSRVGRRRRSFLGVDADERCEASGGSHGMG